MKRTFCVEVERTVTYRRKVWVEVEETNERLKEQERWPTVFQGEATDAAVDKAKRLIGWQQTADEYRACSVGDVESAPNVDVIV